MKRYFKDIFESIWTILIGMKVTFRHLFVPAVTIQYPDVRLKLPERARNRLYVNIDDCIGCDQCSMACPVDCITIETVKSLPTDDLGMTSDGHKKRLWVTKFDIDIAKCCYCGLCVPPCPTECIVMTDVYEFSEFDRHNLIYNYSSMTPEEVGDVKEKYSQWEKDQAAKKAAAAAAKPAASAPPAPKPAEGPQAQPPDSKARGSNQNG
jgi:NADH-quinone oxidoreductase chain I